MLFKQTTRSTGALIRSLKISLLDVRKLRG